MDTLPITKTNDADHCIATWNETLIVIFRRTASVEQLATMTTVARTLMRSQRGPVHLLLIVEPTAPAPSGKTLEQLATFTRDVVTRMGVAVGVAEGGGFRAAAMRTVAATLAMAMPQKVPFKFVNTVEDGAALIAPQLSPASGGFNSLVRAVESLRKPAAASTPAR